MMAVTEVVHKMRLSPEIQNQQKKRSKEYFEYGKYFDNAVFRTTGQLPNLRHLN